MDFKAFTSVFKGATPEQLKARRARDAGFARTDVRAAHRASCSLCCALICADPRAARTHCAG